MIKLDAMAMYQFERIGSYCRTGGGNSTFAMEAFARDPAELQRFKDLWGGNIVTPPPSHPERWTWRLYGKPAEELYLVLRPHLTNHKRAKGDRKLNECYAKRNENRNHS